MISLRKRTTTALIAGGLVVVGGMAAAPALAYPPGNVLAISCSGFAFSPGATVSCTLTNINPAGPNDIVFGDDDGGGSGTVSGNTYTEDWTVPSQPGVYNVVGTSGDEGPVSTTVQVNETGTAVAFSVSVKSNGDVTVQNAVPGCSVTVFVDGTAAGTATVGDDGTATISGVNPANGAKVTASQTASDSCEALEAAPIVVGEGGTGGGGGGGGTGEGGGGGESAAETPKTGANVGLGVAAGIGALAIGGGLYGASRRKKV